ncbi:putative cytochrome P450 9f2 [Pseudolycoriella hygida]|uniref:Cytochrome P450 9f2 n=1 Tax=Pseudolycoriella hygida TaxID=35572 RepID=A0A9Q0MKT8_9DIPT|nr:putative cytochrome P450 9f2 [Pseudolycoriella hygida]
MDCFCALEWILNKWTIVLSIVGYFFYKWSVATSQFFAEKGVPYHKPMPLFGNFLDIVFQKISMADKVIELYNQFKTKRAFGMFEMRNPMLVINDPELIKQITIKDFDHFTERRQFFDKNSEPLIARNLASLTGQQWRDMRSTLSPAFTGSKMRQMFELVVESAENLVSELMKKAKSSTEPYVVEVKDIFTLYTNDVIASTAFGLKINSIQDNNNKFYTLGKKVMNFGGWTGIKLFFVITFPKIARMIKLKVFPSEYMDYFRNLVLDAIKYREAHDIIRPDMIQLLMQAQKGTLKLASEDSSENGTAGFATVEEHEVGERDHHILEDDDLTAQCFVFFAAGFETSAVLSCFTAHEICANADVQSKLIEEVDEVVKSLNGKKLSYDVIQRMKYLDMVVSETLRMWPPAIAFDRVCSKEYTFQDFDGNNITIKKGENLSFPTIGIHRDERYYPNPSRFDPERFSDENKANINSQAYLPFGSGPRNCIGSRFALMETKALIFYLLNSFTLEVSEKTQIPIRLSKSSFKFGPQNGFWIHLKPRVK